jgi:hypothetical protein
MPANWQQLHLPASNLDISGVVLGRSAKAEIHREKSSETEVKC